MEDNNTAPYTAKPKKQDSEVQEKNHAKHSKFYNHFLFKASLLVFFLVVLPLFTSEAPEFINQTLQTRSWEVLQLIFVGIAVSYGLFSKKSDEPEKEQHNSSSKFDNAQSYVSGLLQVSSVFDDETEENQENNKVQTWNNQYHRGEPVVVIAKDQNHHGVTENRAAVSSTRIGEKPLLLPIRSLKSRVVDDDGVGDFNEKIGSLPKTSSSNSGSKRFSSNIDNKSRNGEYGVLSSPKKLEDHLEENVVRPSPIPWRSRSARNMEMKEEMTDNNHSVYTLSNSKQDPEFNKLEPFSLRSQSFRSPRPNNNNTTTNSSSPKNLSPSQSFSSSRKIMSPSLSFSSETQPKNVVEDVVRKKSFRKSTPPPPPPPPPPHFLYKNSPLMKSCSGVSHDNVSSEKELRRSIRSVPMESSGNDKFKPPRKAYSGKEVMDENEYDDAYMDKSVRTLRPFIGSARAKEYGEVEDKSSTDKMVQESYNSGSSKPTYMELPQEEKKEPVEKFLVETDEESETESEDDYFEENSEKTDFETQSTDVDKKADEFIAKFREQIRLQRIESIRRSTGQSARNLVR